MSAPVAEPAAHVAVRFTVAGVEVRSPVWRHPRTGAWLPGVLLPPELADALAREVAACLPALAEAA